MIDINSYLKKLSNQLYNSTEERDKISTSYDYLEGKIFEHFRDRIQEVKLFGSYERGTELPQHIDAESDVDVMVIFKSKEFQPETILNHIHEFADKIYRRSEVTHDHPAIAAMLKHAKFELVPAYWETYTFRDDELKIPAPRSQELKWIVTDPDKLKMDLLKKDKEEGGMLIPLIKLIKYCNSLRNKPYDSFMLEKFAISRRFPNESLKGYFSNSLMI